MNFLRTIGRRTYYQVRRMKKALKNWRRFGVIIFGSLFIISTVAVPFIPTETAIAEGKVAYLYIDPSTLSVKEGDSYQFKYRAEDEDHNPITVTPNWSMNNSTAGNINSNGYFTASHNVGTYNNAVKLTAGALAVYARVIVFKDNTPVLSRVEINPSSATLDKGEGTQFTAIAYNQNNEVLNNVNYSWAVINGGGSIDTSSGYFIAGDFDGTYGNTVKVTAEINNVVKFDFATVTVLKEFVPEVILHNVIVSPSNVILDEGKHQQYSATAYDQNGNILVSGVDFSWAVVNGGGHVGSYSGSFTAGNVEGTYNNTVRVRAEMDNIVKYDFATVIVNSIITQTVLDRVEVFPPEITISTNQSFDFDAQAYDNNNNPVFSDVTYFWSVISGSGSVNQNGLYEATDYSGTALVQVRATQGGRTRYDTATVTITGGGGNDILSYVTISPQIAYLYPGENVDFSAQAYDTNGYAISASYSWYVEDVDAGSINHNGYFTASNNIGSYYNSIRVRAYKDGVERSDYADVVVRTSGQDYSISTSLNAIDENGGTTEESDVILYTLNLTNNRSNRLTNVVTTFKLPNNTRFVSATSTSGAPRISNGTITWSTGELYSNQTKTMSLRVQVNKNLPRYTVISGKAFVQASELDNGIWVYANDLTVAGTGPTEPLTPTGVMHWLLAFAISLLATMLTRKILYTRKLLNR